MGGGACLTRVDLTVRSHSICVNDSLKGGRELVDPVERRWCQRGFQHV